MYDLYSNLNLKYLNDLDSNHKESNPNHRVSNSNRIESYPVRARVFEFAHH